MFKVLVKGCEPSRGSKYSACVDLYASEDVVIGASETKLVGLGVCIDFDKLESAVHLELSNKIWHANACYGENLSTGINSFMSRHYLQLMLRSSLSKELIIANGVGVIDLDYEDEIKIMLHKPMVQNTVDLSAKTILVGALCLNEGVCSKDAEEAQREFLTPHTKELFSIIKKGDRIAQITLVEHKSYLFGVNTDSERTGGFGSTDEKN